MFTIENSRFNTEQCRELNRVVTALLRSGVDDDEAHRLAADAWIDDADAPRMLATIQAWGHAEQAHL